MSCYQNSFYVARTMYIQHVLSEHFQITNNVFDFFYRMWDLDKDDNFVLALDAQAGFETGETINCVAYCPGKSKLSLLV